MSTDYDQIKKTQNEQFDNMDPAITNKKTETEKKVEQIRATKKRLIKEYREKLNAYDDQQAMIKKLEWMTNAKQRLIKQKAYLEEEEKRRIQQEEERKELNDNVYSEEIRLCEFLIRYCKQFQKKEQKEIEDKKKEEQKKNNLENEKLEVI